MKYPVRLFLVDEEVEFSTPPEILFNYSETELTNPTIVKNSYSKTLTIEGTPHNNRIFGHIYNMERLQSYQGGVMGTAFNPLLKTDFTLYYNGSIYESGYFKLNEVRRNKNNIQYDITLYGGLGDFFYNLSFREDGNAMELSDLTYWYEKWSGEDLGFTINKETVREAWNNIGSGDPKWGTINFAPCYNGIPTAISADKVLINNSGVTDYSPTGTSKTYSMGTTFEELTEWETFDLRSYLQRPVMRVSEVIDAICDPDNNGGYSVNLDQSFFNISNPYYNQAWFTLPMLTELDSQPTEPVPFAVSALTREDDYIYGIYSGLSSVSNVSIDLGVGFTPEDGYSGSSIYLIRSYWCRGVNVQNRMAKAWCSDTCITMQMLGYNADGQIVATSDLYYLTSYVTDDFYFKNSVDYAKEVFNSVGPQTDVRNVVYKRGKFTRKNGQYVWTNDKGTEMKLNFRFPSNAEFSTVKMKIVVATRQHLDYTGTRKSRNTSGTNWLTAWSVKVSDENVFHDATIIENQYKVDGSLSFVSKGATGTTASYESFYSGRQYGKKELLSLGITPADFLLSYAKIFGLYFVKDVESKTIDILTRHNFYERDNIVNINDIIDKGSDIKITPCSPKYQYYDFGLEQVESDAASSYKKTYGSEYGTAIVNTGYEFEKEHKALLDGNCFKAGVMALEKSKYMLKPVWGSSQPAINNGPMYVNNGFSYWYYTSGDETEELSKDSKPMTGSTINPDGLKYYDVFPKPQFYTEEHNASDGRLVLLFHDGTKYLSNLGYHLTDDVQQMYMMNDGQPCWIMTRGTADKAGTTIALDVYGVPFFTRDLYNQYGYISNSYDLGTPLTTYVPKIYVSDWQSIYSKGWKSYISDLYNVNTRVLNCKCLLTERPNPDWMRRFYWFDNSYWRLNKIKDWNLSSFGTTEMEFIKVQDISDYDNVAFSIVPTVEWRLDTYSVGASGGTITGYIYVSDGSRIYTDGEDELGDYPVHVTYSGGASENWYPLSNYMTPTQAHGAVNVPVTLTIPANPSGESRTISFTVLDSTYPEPGSSHYVTITQERAVTGTPVHIADEYPRYDWEYYSQGGAYKNNYGTQVRIIDEGSHGWELVEPFPDWILRFGQYFGTTYRYDAQDDYYYNDYTNAEWRPSPISGVGNYTLDDVEAMPNSGAARTGTILLKDIALNTTSAITLTQDSGTPENAYVFTIYSGSSYSRQTTTLNVSTAVTVAQVVITNKDWHPWAITTDADWIEFKDDLYKPFYGGPQNYRDIRARDGNNGCTVTIRENTGTARTATLVFTEGTTQATTNITIIQQGQN